MQDGPLLLSSPARRLATIQDEQNQDVLTVTLTLTTLQIAQEDSLLVLDLCDLLEAITEMSKAHGS